MQFPFIGQAYDSDSLDVEECVNLYLEVSPSGRKKLVKTPGLLSFADLGNAPVRGGHKPANYDAVMVCGNQVYRVKSDATTTLLGTIGSSTGPVSMADNGTSLLIVDGTAQGFAVDLPSYTLSPINDEGFYGADNVRFLDGRFILNRPNTGQFYISGLYALTFDPLEFATAEKSPDNLVAHIVDHDDLYLFGETTTERWVNTGAVDFPFERVQGGSMEMGCAARHSVALFDNTVAWLGQDKKGAGMVWLANGGSPMRISTHALEKEFLSYATMADAQAYVYQQAGHEFYVLTFPTAGKTWAFDAATRTWHRRAYLSTGEFTRHRSNCYLFAYGKHLVGDFENGNVYELDLATYSDNGDPIQWLRSCQVLQTPDYNWQQFNTLQIEMETGVGLQSGQGSEPLVLLSYSDDGGKTWSNERSASIGRAGEYKTRVRWNRLGRSSARIFRVRGSDPVKTEIYSASINGGA